MSLTEYNVRCLRIDAMDAAFADHQEQDPRGMSADELVRRVIAAIPEGRVTTYGAIARAAGLGGDARRVGWIISGLDDDHDLPCHRVVNVAGHLSGGWAFGHPDRMRAMLEEEDVMFVGPYDVDMARHFWEPETSTSTDEMDDLENIP